MNREECIVRFENELRKVNRDGIEDLIKYCQKGDMYTAPSSTQYHMSVNGGLLIHSLNVLDALRSLLQKNEDGSYSYMVAGKEVARVTEETVIVIALLHDLCKIGYYGVEKRNKKIDGKWEEVDFYKVDDKIPYGHGEKSVMRAMEFIKLTTEEKMAIRWHMGFPDDYAGKQSFGKAIEMFPIVWELHNADMQAAHFMEDETDNKEAYRK